MRLQRASLIDHVSDALGDGAVVLEAPAGYGKSWLIRKLVPAGSTRLRSEFGVADESRARDADATVVIDDAHLLSEGDVGRLADFIEAAPGGTRVLIAGRLLPQRILKVVQLVDGHVVDEVELSVTAGELGDDVEDIDMSQASKVVDAAEGCVRTIRAAFEEAGRKPGASPAAVAADITRDASATVLQSLTAADREVVGLLARAPNVDEHVLARLGGPDVLRRLVAAGVPVRRDAAGRLDIATSYAFRVPVGRRAAAQLAGDLVARDRAVEATELLLEAGDAESAAELLREQSDSLIDTVEPRLLLKLLGGLGRLVDRDPELLLLRGGAFAAIGRLGDTIADTAAAAELVTSASPALQRRVQVESARARLAEGRIDLAITAAEQALVDLGSDEHHTYARAHEILAECAATSESRADLQRAAEEYLTAAAGWERCNENARARACRRSLAMGVLVSLGRIDESLAQLGLLLAEPQLTDAERAWTVLGEGFVLANGGRLSVADERFRDISEIGRLQGNPRLIAAAAWGRALVATCHDDLQQTLQWVWAAENTVLEADDDLLGVQFLLDASLMLGALGELALAERYLKRATEWPSAFPAQTTLAQFVLDARRGKLGDVDAQLAATAPSQWWRVLLVSAHAAARNGDLDRARELGDDAYRELLALGFDDASVLGERREQEGLRAALGTEPARVPSSAFEEPVTSSPSGPHLSVIGGPMSVSANGDSIPVPPGNPQRLVGVTVANGGSATFDQLSEAIWPGDDVEASRSRLRNVMLRLRKAVGDVLARTNNGVRLAQNVSCDLYEFDQLANDATSVLRADPEMAGHLALQALAVGDGTAFAEFEYEEWATHARRAMESKMIELFDLLSIQAEDAGDYATASLYVDKAIRLDRYGDSRYVRRADLQTLQGRHAAAKASLEEASAVARELAGDLVIEGDELLRESADPTPQTQRR